MQKSTGGQHLKLCGPAKCFILKQKFLPWKNLTTRFLPHQPSCLDPIWFLPSKTNKREILVVCCISFIITSQEARPWKSQLFRLPGCQGAGKLSKGRGLTDSHNFGRPSLKFTFLMEVNRGALQDPHLPGKAGPKEGEGSRLALAKHTEEFESLSYFWWRTGRGLALAVRTGSEGWGQPSRR